MSFHGWHGFVAITGEEMQKRITQRQQPAKNARLKLFSVKNDAGATLRS
jgi:hypothetical protein